MLNDIIKRVLFILYIILSTVILIAFVGIFEPIFPEGNLSILVVLGMVTLVTVVDYIVLKHLEFD